MPKIDNFYYEFQHINKRDNLNDEYESDIEKEIIKCDIKNEKKFKEQIFKIFIEKYLDNFLFSNDIILYKYDLYSILFDMLNSKEDFYNFLIGNLTYFKNSLNKNKDFIKLKKEGKILSKIKEDFYNIFENILKETLDNIMKNENISLNEAIDNFNYNDKEYIIDNLNIALKMNYSKQELREIFNTIKLTVSQIYNNFKEVGEYNLENLSELIYTINEEFQLTQRYFGNKILNGGKFRINLFGDEEEYYSDLNSYYFELLSYNIDENIRFLFDLLKYSNYICNNMNIYNELYYGKLKKIIEKSNEDKNYYYSNFFGKIILQKDNFGTTQLLFETWTNRDNEQEYIYYFKMYLN